MSHKVAKAYRAAMRGAATPDQMHMLIIDKIHQRRRLNAHKLNDRTPPRTRSAKTRKKGKIRQASLRLQGLPIEAERQT